MKIELKDYEVNLKRLMDIINALESKDTTLEESIKLYNEGKDLYIALKAVLEEEKGNLMVYNSGKFEKMGGFEID